MKKNLFVFRRKGSGLRKKNAEGKKKCTEGGMLKDEKEEDRERERER